MTFFNNVRAALDCRDPGQKGAAVAALEIPQADADFGDPKSIDTCRVLAGHLIAGRPATPVLVSPGKVARRGLGSEHGRAALIHAIAHIEFNAINLALDAVWRYRGLPRDFYVDWLSVAKDEARHFQMLVRRLAALGAAYGDLDAHNGLWKMAVDTAHDLTIRMALVPRVLEARGLDVTPGMIEKLQRVGDTESAQILEVIADEERGHVAIGTRWFQFACQLEGSEPDSRFEILIEEYASTIIRPPINHEARRASGFSDNELAFLDAMIR